MKPVCGCVLAERGIGLVYGGAHVGLDRSSWIAASFYNSLVPAVEGVPEVSQLTADSWPGARAQIFASANGRHRFRTRPPQLATWSGKGTGTVVSVGPDGSETAVWSRELLNIPVIAFITDDGKHVVTFDTWAKLGYEHAIVVYGERGAVVVDYDLEALLSSEEIDRHVRQTIGARRWLQGATIAFDTGDTHIVINLSWGTIIRIALATGRIETAR